MPHSAHHALWRKYNSSEISLSITDLEFRNMDNDWWGCCYLWVLSPMRWQLDTDDGSLDVTWVTAWVSGDWCGVLCPGQVTLSLSAPCTVQCTVYSDQPLAPDTDHAHALPHSGELRLAAMPGREKGGTGEMSAVRCWSVELTHVQCCTVYCITDKCQASPVPSLACSTLLWSCIHLIAKGIPVMKNIRGCQKFVICYHFKPRINSNSSLIPHDRASALITWSPGSVSPGPAPWSVSANPGPGLWIQCCHWCRGRGQWIQCYQRPHSEPASVTARFTEMLCWVNKMQICRIQLSKSYSV